MNKKDRFVYSVFDRDKCLYVEEKEWESYKKGKKWIDAAGGIVKNKSGELLLIFRLGFWDLPKGKLEKGENPEAGALREVEEECGIGELSIVKKLNQSYHTYELKGKQVIKRTFWFEMNYAGSSVKLTPQLEENITDAQWLRGAALQKAVRGAYPMIREVLGPYLL